MKPQSRERKVPEKFSHDPDHVLMIDRKEKSIMKKQKKEDQDSDKTRKRAEREQKGRVKKVQNKGTMKGSKVQTKKKKK